MLVAFRLVMLKAPVVRDSRAFIGFDANPGETQSNLSDLLYTLENASRMGRLALRP